MATPARKMLTAEQRDRVQTILFHEMQVWVQSFGPDLVRETLDAVERRARGEYDPDHEPPAGAAVLAFPRQSSTSNAVASDA